MNVADSSAWLEYFADGPNAGYFASAIEAIAPLSGASAEARLDGCHLSWMETQILTHFKLHTVNLREIS